MPGSFLYEAFATQREEGMFSHQARRGVLLGKLVYPRGACRIEISILHIVLFDALSFICELHTATITQTDIRSVAQ